MNRDGEIRLGIFRGGFEESHAAPANSVRKNCPPLKTIKPSFTYLHRVVPPEGLKNWEDRTVRENLTSKLKAFLETIDNKSRMDLYDPFLQLLESKDTEVRKLGDQVQIHFHRNKVIELQDRYESFKDEDLAILMHYMFYSGINNFKIEGRNTRSNLVYYADSFREGPLMMTGSTLAIPDPNSNGRRTPLYCYSSNPGDHNYYGTFYQAAGRYSVGCDPEAKDGLVRALHDRHNALASIPQLVEHKTIYEHLPKFRYIEDTGSPMPYSRIKATEFELSLSEKDRASSRKAKFISAYLEANAAPELKEVFEHCEDIIVVPSREIREESDVTDTYTVMVKTPKDSSILNKVPLWEQFQNSTVTAISVYCLPDDSHIEFTQDSDKFNLYREISII